MKLLFGIRGQLTAGIVLTTVAGIGMIGLIAIKVVESRSLYWKVTEADNLVRVVGTATARLSAPGDTQRAKALAESLIKGAGITDFEIIDDSGKTVVRGGSLAGEKGSAIRSPDRLRVRMLGGGWFSGVGTDLFIQAKLPGAATGSFNFMMPLSDIKRDMAGVKKFLFFYALLDSVIIIGFGVYFLSRSITTPVRKLTEAATRISGGALGERADVEVDNEIQSLAASFNTMAERIENEIKTLERVNLELMTTQEKLLRSSTLAAVGRLAAGIAHEVGNPLGAVNGYLDILSRGVDDKEEEKEIIERTAREIERIDSIIREFLDISRPPAAPSGPVDVNRVLLDALLGVQASGELAGIRVDKRLADGLPHVMIEEGKLRQVLWNLLVNAAQSMDGPGGGITVATSVEAAETEPSRMLRRRRDDPPLSQGGSSETQFVVVEVTDTGAGMDEADAAKVFEPFFTTKEVGRGTGLGLFVSESIVKAYGGMIDFSTSPGQGSTFIVRLPSEAGVKA